MSNIKASQPELVETTESTTRIKATGTYDSVTDKMSQDVGITDSPDLRAVVYCLGKIDEKLEKLLTMIGEVTNIEESEL